MKVDLHTNCKWRQHLNNNNKNNLYLLQWDMYPRFLGHYISRQSFITETLFTKAYQSYVNSNSSIRLKMSIRRSVHYKFTYVRTYIRKKSVSGVGICLHVVILINWINMWIHTYFLKVKETMCVTLTRYSFLCILSILTSSWPCSWIYKRIYPEYVRYWFHADI